MLLLCSAEFISILRIAALPFCQIISVIVTCLYSPSPKRCLSIVLVLWYRSELLYLRMSSSQDWPGKSLDTYAYPFSFISPVTVCRSKYASFYSMFFIYSTLVNSCFILSEKQQSFWGYTLLKLLIRNKLFVTTVLTCKLQVCCPA